MMRGEWRVVGARRRIAVVYSSERMASLMSNNLPFRRCKSDNIRAANGFGARGGVGRHGFMDTSLSEPRETDRGARITLRQ